MSVERILYNKNGICEVCRQKIATLTIQTETAAGYYKVEDEVVICKKCFNDIFNKKKDIKFGL